MSADEIPDEVQTAVIDALSASSPDHPVLTARERALIAYADKLTVAASTITRDDIARLQEVGLDDLGIHDACSIVAYFAFVNRIADGLGVEIEAPP